MDITTIIFDFDGVVSPDNTGLIYAKFMDAIGDESFEAKVLASKKLYQCMMGQLSFADFNDELARIAHVDLQVAEQISKSIIETRTLNKDTMNVVRQLKEAGFSLVLYSDEIKVRFDQWIRKLGLKDIFDSQICSAYIGSLKSNPESFQKVMTFLGKKPEECLFIDDNPANVMSAEANKIKAITFRDAVQLARKLEDFGIVL